MIDTIIFIEIILTEGAFRIKERTIDEYSAGLYVMPNGKNCWIMESEDELTRTVVEVYLRNLGLNDLMERVFDGFFQ